MKNKRAVIIQCRLSSTRLPQKALKDLGGKTVLDWCLSSMKKVSASEYYVATDDASFEILEPICKRNGFKCFAGDLNNVLKRFCDLIKKIDVDTIIRATADNPFLFYEAAIATVEEFEKKNKNSITCDYLTFSGLPHGSGVEVFSAKSLLKAAEQTDSPYDQEHVGPALYNHKDKFNCEFVRAPSRFYFPALRTTIDTPADYLRAISIVNYLNNFNTGIENKEPFTTEQIVSACNSDYIQDPVLYMPSVKKGHGTGHLRRCLELALKTHGFIYIPDNATLEEVPQILMEYQENGLMDYQIINSISDDCYPQILVTDLFKITEDEYSLVNKFKSVIAIDEGSEYIEKLDYVLDIIPSYDENKNSNLIDSAYISKPKNKKSNRRDSIDSILVCIGGEDPANLTKPAVEIAKELFPLANIKAIGKGFDAPISNLKEKVFEYDLVITHYGLTAFEAASAGCKVIMLATTKLHELLAQKYNYAYVPYNSLTVDNMKKALSSENILPNKNNDEKDLSTLINELSKGKKMLCPVCQDANASDVCISRNETRTYRRCSTCSLVYMSWSCVKDKTYEKAYFFEDYKKQYGKTYKEDFDSIKQQCIKRVAVIDSFVSKNASRNILDIGCAYGPFLKAAQEKDYNPFGTDISEDAINYVKNELNFPATVAGFPEINTTDEFGHGKFDVVTMWYVIEHFKNLDTVLSKINSIVKIGGIFAFSTPSGEGISAVSDKDHFYQISPTDHFSVWEPSKANKILKKYGFKIVKIVSTGHHPERFPEIKKSGAKKDSIQWKIIEHKSHLKKLGDTVEIYCRKISEYEK